LPNIKHIMLDWDCPGEARGRGEPSVRTRSGRLRGPPPRADAGQNQNGRTRLIDGISLLGSAGGSGSGQGEPVRTRSERRGRTARTRGHTPTARRGRTAKKMAPALKRKGAQLIFGWLGGGLWAGKMTVKAENKRALACRKCAVDRAEGWDLRSKSEAAEESTRGVSLPEVPWRRGCGWRQSGRGCAANGSASGAIACRAYPAAGREAEICAANQKPPGSKRGAWACREYGKQLWERRRIGARRPKNQRNKRTKSDHKIVEFGKKSGA